LLLQLVAIRLENGGSNAIPCVLAPAGARPVQFRSPSSAALSRPLIMSQIMRYRWPSNSIQVTMHDAMPRSHRQPNSPNRLYLLGVRAQGATTFCCTEGYLEGMVAIVWSTDFHSGNCCSIRMYYLIFFLVEIYCVITTAHWSLLVALEPRWFGVRWSAYIHPRLRSMGSSVRFL